MSGGTDDGKRVCVRLSEGDLVAGPGNVRLTVLTHAAFACSLWKPVQGFTGAEGASNPVPPPQADPVAP